MFTKRGIEYRVIHVYVSELPLTNWSPYLHFIATTPKTDYPEHPSVFYFTYFVWPFASVQGAGVLSIVIAIDTIDFFC